MGAEPSSSSAPSTVIAGKYTTIQAAVDAAKPGDWILVAPGRLPRDRRPEPVAPVDPAHGEFGGVLITTPDLHLRGMDRSTVIVDGTKAGAPGSCSCEPGRSELRSRSARGGKPAGRNGIVVWKANDVSVENLTVCNFLGGAGDAGNEIWWNGGAGSGQDRAARATPAAI